MRKISRLSIMLAFYIMILLVSICSAGAATNLNEGGIPDGVSEEVVRENTTRLPSQITSPKVIEFSEPIYPVDARLNNMEGKVVLRVTISDEGMVVGTEILQSSGFTILDNAAVESVGKWRFSPAKENGREVLSRVRVPVIFTLQDVVFDPIDITTILQQKLNELGFNCGEADGIMGPRTKAAIMDYQKSMGLEPNGIIDQKTKEALGL